MQSFRPSADPDDAHGEATGSIVEVMDWLNTFPTMCVESLTAVPQDDGPPIYVVLWRQP